MANIGPFLEGFRAMTPLLLGIAPFGAVYAVSARAAGIGLLDTQLLSLLLFAGGSQFAVVGLYASGAGMFELVLSAFLINLRHLLYGVVVRTLTPLAGGQRLVAAHLLTDEAFGLHVTHGHGRPGYLLGAGLSLFLTWNAATLVGALVADFLPDPRSIGVDLIFPLTFVALAVPLLHSKRVLGVALFAGAATLLFTPLMGEGLAIVAAAVLAAAAGALALRRGQGDA
jgi:predicted branched-subunit amino acid permease